MLKEFTKLAPYLLKHTTMKKIVPILLMSLLFTLQMVLAQNAPVTTIANEVTYGSTAVVPITVTGFANMGGCDLLIHYDPSIATATSVSLDPLVPAYYFIGNISTPGQISVSWLFFSPGYPGVTLPDNSVFLNITFNRVGYGYSALEFDFGNQLYCEYYDYEFNQLNDIPNSTFYFDGSVTFATGGTQWTGNIDNDWSDPLNWDAGVPGVANVAVINNVSPNLFPSASTNAECLGLDIASGASVTVPVNKSLTVYGNLNNNGQFNIISTSAGDGSFINYGSITGNGTVSVGRYLTSGGWHYVSPPIADGLSEIFLDIYLMDWDEPSGTWSNIVPTNISLNPMQGYAAYPDDNLTGTTTVYYETSSANLNYGTYVSAPLTASGPNTSPPNDTRGFNFVGNPYPSAVDWNIGAGWDITNLSSTIYLWNPAVGNYGSYVKDAPQGTNGVDNIIPSGQGFYVHNPNDGTTASLTINNNARVHDSKPFLKGSESEQQSIYLSISSEINTYSDELFLSFNDNASTDFDPAYDALNLKGDDDAPDLFAHSTDNKNLSINTYPALAEGVIMPIGCAVGVDGYYTITATEISNFNEVTEILLEDKTENTFIDLLNQSAYTFYAASDDDSERFNLHILLNPTNTIEIENDLNVQIFAVNSTIHIKRQDAKILEGSFKVYDLLGKLISSMDIIGVNQYELLVGEQGVFVVSFIDRNQQKEYRQKVFLK